MVGKKAHAFRTIREVSDWLDTPPHALRFWESKFSQIKPVKRKGGHRYYRPEDLKIIGGIKVLLHQNGKTIAAVNEIFDKLGVAHVKKFSPELVFASNEKHHNKNDASNVEKNQIDNEAKDFKAMLKQSETRENYYQHVINHLDQVKNLTAENILALEDIYLQLIQIKNRLKRSFNRI